MSQIVPRSFSQEFWVIEHLPGGLSSHQEIQKDRKNVKGFEAKDDTQDALKGFKIQSGPHRAKLARPRRIGTTSGDPGG